MRPRPTDSEPAQPIPPIAPTPPVPTWRDRLTRYRQPIGLAVTLLLFVLAIVACRRLLMELDLQALHDAVLAVPGSALSTALLATLASFAALLGYEWSGSRYADVKVPPRSLLLAGFSAFAIGNAVGLSILSGGAVRYRLYSREGIGAISIGRMTLFGSLSLGLALPLLASAACLFDLQAASHALHLPEALLGGASLAILAFAAGMTVLLARHRQAERPAADALSVRFGEHSLRVPSLRLSLLQLVISSVDVIAAATVLYALLPAPPPFSSFVLVYLLALAAGVLSHVPGGVGVFEAVLLAAFGAQMETAPLAAALLLYRLIYVMLPLFVACLALLANEALRLRASVQAVKLANGPAAPVLALLVFASGVVMLFSGATPAIDTRLEYLGFLVPHRLIDASHLGASLIGTLYLLLAQGLRRRLSAAWAITLVLLLVGALLSLLKGFDWEEATVLVVTACLLSLFRAAFYRPSRLFGMPMSWSYFAAAVSVVVASVWLMFFAYQDVPYEHEMWWQFALDADAPRSLRGALGSALLLVAIGLGWLLRTHPPEVALPDEDALQRAARVLKNSAQPDGGLALSGDKALLFHPSGEAFLMYARRGRSMVALYDPIGPVRHRAELIWQFRDLCDLHHARPVFYQVRGESLPLYMDIGLTALKLGEEARVDLVRFDLDAKHKDMKDLRYTLSRGQRDGLTLEIHEPGAAPLDELRAISDAWLEGKPAREKGFSLGRFTPDYLRFFRVALIRHEGRAVAFANLLETDRRELASLDLMRVHPQAPKLTMEFLMLSLILHYKAQGHAYFSLGMVPLAGLQPRRGAPMAQRLGALVFRRGGQFYNFQGLRRFKDKFQPDWEPRYLAVPAGLDPFVALADTAALIAGGLTGLVKR